MSKERLLKILHEFHEDNNWLCYEYDKDLNGFHLYENGNKMAKFVLDNYGLVMINGIDIPPYCRKVIRVAIAKYITQEEELRNKKYKYKVPKFLGGGLQCYLVRDIHDDRFVISYGILSVDSQALFTDEEMKNLIEKHGDDFKTFIEMCEKCD